jgi:hypothetical protein
MLYKIYNGHMPTTAAMAPVATGTAIKTLMQLQANASASFKVKGWGISFDGITAATPIRCELIETGTIGGGTAIAYVAADVYPYENALGENWIGQLGASASGFSPTTEGTITATRLGDYQFVAPTNQYLYDWVLSNEFQVSAGKFCRVRVTAAASVNAICYIMIEQ